MKVLMLGWELPPYHSGGLGVACYQMCKELSTHSDVDIEFILPYTATHDVDFMRVTHATPVSAEDFLRAGSVYDLPTHYNSAESFGSSLLHEEYARRVAGLVVGKEFDVIHAQDWLTFRAGVIAKQVTGKPLILHVHATQYDQSAGGQGNPLAREIEYQAFHMADKIFAISDYTKDILVAHYDVPASSIEVVRNGMSMPPDVDEHHSAHRYLTHMKSRGYKVVVNIGRQTIQKGLTQFLEAAYKALQVNPKLLFVLAGRGEQRHELMELAAHFKLSKNVIFIDWVSGKTWRDTYKIGDVFVMPSVSEPFGLTALESIAFGVPVIVSKTSGVGEVLRHCYKVDYWDTTLLADQIVNLCDRPALAQTMWQHSYKELQSNSWVDAAQSMRGHYQSLIGVHA